MKILNTKSKIHLYLRVLNNSIPLLPLATRTKLTHPAKKSRKQETLNLGMFENGENSSKQLKKLKTVEFFWKSWKWLKTVQNGWKQLEMDENNWKEWQTAENGLTVENVWKRLKALENSYQVEFPRGAEEDPVDSPTMHGRMLLLILT